MKMNERFEQYAHLLGEIVERTNNIAASVNEIKQIYHQQIITCRQQYVSKDAFEPIAGKVRVVTLAVLTGFIGALVALVFRHG